MQNVGQSRLKIIDGLRAIAILWVIACHCVWFLGFVLPDAQFRDVLANHLFTFFLNGRLGVDLFFVLSGFLISSILIRELDATGTLSFKRFYTRRAFRIIPVYWLVLLFVSFLNHPLTKGRAYWANLCFVNNFIPFEKQGIAWTWSLAIEEQFYLIFPVLLLAIFRFRKKWLQIFFGLLVCGWLIRLAVLLKYQAQFPSAPHPMIDRASFSQTFDLFYDKTYTRFGGLICGVIVALLFRSKKVLRALVVHPNWALMGALVSGFVVVLASVIPVPLVSYMKLSPAEVLGVSLDQYLFAAAAGYLLLFGLSGTSYSWPLTRILEHKVWLPIAERSYSAYLIHPLMIVGLYEYLLKTQAPGAYFLLAVVGSYGLTFIFASFLLRFVEDPFRKFGKSLS